MAVSAKRGRPLTSEEIHATALRLIDAGGADGLSMRKLAAELDVNPMSVYHHVESKTALIRGVCDLVAARLRLPPDDGTPWQDQLRALAHAYRAMAQAHPALWTYVTAHPGLIDPGSGLWAVFTRILQAVGVPEEDLAHTRAALYTFVSGFLAAETAGTLAEQQPAVEPDRTFEIALDLIIGGLTARYA